MSGLYQITYSQARADKPSGILRQRRNPILGPQDLLVKSLGVTPPALGAQPRSCTRVAALGAQLLPCTRVVTPGAQLLPYTLVSAVSGCWHRQMPRGVWNIHTESPPSPTSRTAPSNLLGGRTEDLGLAQTWPLPSLTGAWGGSGGCIHPPGWWLPPSLRAVGIPLSHRPRVSQGCPPSRPVQARPDPSGASQGRSHPLGRSALGPWAPAAQLG
nr:uncharacterized protein LOC110122044 isoform X1 [Odocoileus virginianus texanus]